MCNLEEMKKVLKEKLIQYEGYEHFLKLVRSISCMQFVVGVIFVHHYLKITLSFQPTVQGV